MNSSTVTEESSAHTIVKTLNGFGLDEIGVSRFLVILSPALQRYLNDTFLQILSDEEIETLNIVADEEDFSETQKNVLFGEAVLDKSGKDVNAYIKQFYDIVDNTLMKCVLQIDELTDKMTGLNESEKDKLVDEFFDKNILI